MCREEMIAQIVDALNSADNTTVEQMYWLLMENIGQGGHYGSCGHHLEMCLGRRRRRCGADGCRVSDRKSVRVKGGDPHLIGSKGVCSGS